jgi:hypothetical protein
LPLDVLLLVNLSTQHVNICNNSCIDKMDECIIYKLAIDRAGVEDDKVGIFDTWGVEIGMRVSASVQSHAIDGVTLLVTSLDGHTIFDRDIVDILSYLSVPLLIAKEKLVVSWVGAIIEHPVIARVVSIFLSLHTSIDDAELGRSGNEKHRSFICGAFTVWVDEIDEGWYPSQVDDLIVFLEVAWGLLLTSHIGKGVYGRY